MNSTRSKASQSPANKVGTLFLRNDFHNAQDIRKAGFEGFFSICDPQAVECSGVPDGPGVYLVLITTTAPPEFLPLGTGGYFKGKNPNSDITVLKKRWIDDAVVLYIGKAGGSGDATLSKRLSQYMKFGQQRNIGHWGGRYIWQLRDSSDLIVCWKIITDRAPREVEKELIQAFVKCFSKLPFANINY